VRFLALEEQAASASSINLPHQSFIRKTKVTTITDNNVIKNLNSHEFARGG